MTSLTTGHEATAALSFLWLEITGKCQLRCVHCYAESGPQGTHGTMKTDNWRRVIDEAATLGTRMVQFIGGEPTLHPALSELVGHVLSRGMTVEVFSNLVHVSSHLWSVFSRPGVRLATSYDVWPCVFARWMFMGNVQTAPLREIVTVSKMEATRAKVSAPWSSTEKCAPETPKCSPETQCQPANDPCQPHCPPGYHSEPKRCWPYYYQERKQ
jgi:hypothetical protein